MFKAFRALKWNEMSVRYEPVNRYLPPDAPGQASETTLDSGLGGAFLVSFLGDFLVLLAVLWHTHVLKTRGVWLSRDPDFFSAATAPAAATTPTATAGATEPRSSSASSSAPVLIDSPATPMTAAGGGKQQKKPKRRPLSWSPSLYRKRLASPTTTPSEEEEGGGRGALGLLGTGGGGGMTTPKTAPAAFPSPLTPGGDDEVEQVEGRPASTRSTTSAPESADGGELRRGESIITTTTATSGSSSSSSSSTSSNGKPPSCLTRVFGPFLDTARAKPGSDLYVSLFFIQCLLFLFVLFAYQQADHLVQSVRENQLSGGFILVLLLHFILIVVDRVIYLHRSIRWKLILQARGGVWDFGDGLYERTNERTNERARP